jgi:hypothetical protein
MKKNECGDIFKDIKMHDNDELEQKDYKLWLKNKIAYKSKKIQYDRINLLLKLRLIKGVLFLDTILKRIELVKEMFILDVESAKEVLIPNDLC